MSWRSKWPLIAVKDKSEMWTPEASNIAKKCASAEISVRSGEAPTPDQINEALEKAA